MTLKGSAVSFAHNLDHLLHHSRMQNVELAEILGVRPEYVSRMRHQPMTYLSFEHLDRLLEHFHIDANTLLS